MPYRHLLTKIAAFSCIGSEEPFTHQECHMVPPFMTGDRVKDLSVLLQALGVVAPIPRALKFWIFLTPNPFASTKFAC